MDKSKQYIKMCEKAQEIQSMWKHSERTDGDWYYHKKMDYVYVVTNIEQEDEDCVYLPRQDQLQEMIEGDVLDTLIKFNAFVEPSGVIDFSLDVDKESIEKFKKEWRKITSESGNNNIPLVINSDIKFTTIESVCLLHSMEQLWLAFVMKEKYSKFWNKEKAEWMNY